METGPVFTVFAGIDVGKSGHHLIALDREGHRLADRVLVQDQGAIGRTLEGLAAQGEVVVVVDQPRNIGALVVAVAQSMGLAVRYLPGLAMRRFAQVHPGSAKTDARDAYLIAEAARRLPETLRPVTADSDELADLRMLAGLDDDLAVEATRLVNRIRGVLVDVHPALERALGPYLDRPVGAALLTAFGGPAGITAAGRRRVRSLIRKHAPRSAARVATAVEDALTAQTVVVAGTTAADRVLKTLGGQLTANRQARADLETEFTERLDAHPFGPILTSMPGIGARIATKILVEIGDIDQFPTPGHLASYAGLAPVTRQSGTSIHGEHQQRAGNKRLKKALFRAAFAALADPDSRAYYDRKRAEGKRHNAAIGCLARRRCNVLHAMLTHHTTYTPHHTQQTATAA